MCSEILAGKETEAKDIRQWDSQCIECVAKEIENRLKNIKAGAVSMSKPALTRMVRECRFLLCRSDSLNQLKHPHYGIYFMTYI